MVEGCLQSCQSFKGLSKGAQGSLQQEVALLHIQANLIAIAESIPGDAASGESLSAAKGVQPFLLYYNAYALLSPFVPPLVFAQDLLKDSEILLRDIAIPLEIHDEALHASHECTRFQQ